jgi:hypothetical protein
MPTTIKPSAHAIGALIRRCGGKEQAERTNYAGFVAAVVVATG